MAGVTPWLLALLALMPGIVLAVVMACRGDIIGRLVATQLVVALATLVLVLMTFAFDQPAFADLPLSLALLNLPGTLVMALFLERWL